MRISKVALDLLNLNKISALQTLTLEELLDAEDYAEYLRSCREPDNPSIFKNFNLPVVVSNGYIYSESSAIKLFKSAGPVKCHVTNVELQRDQYGPEGAKRSYVRLPQLIAAKKELKGLSCRALEDKAAPVSGVLPTAAGAGDLPPLVPPLRRDSYTLRVKVSGSKMRVLITSEAESDLTPLSLTLSAAFKHNKDSMIPSSTVNYTLDGFGRCWQVKQSIGARLEFWFLPECHLISDKEINELLSALLSPLKLTSERIPPGTPFGSIDSLRPREYKDAIEPISISLSQAIACCNNFVTEVQRISDIRGIVLVDKVIEVKESPSPAIHSGMMLFGGRLRAPAGAGSAQPPLSTSSPRR